MAEGMSLEDHSHYKESHSDLCITWDRLRKDEIEGQAECKECKIYTEFYSRATTDMGGTDAISAFDDELIENVSPLHGHCCISRHSFWKAIIITLGKRVSKTRVL
jgi:hypothetical protein